MRIYKLLANQNEDRRLDERQSRYVESVCHRAATDQSTSHWR